MYSTIWIQDLMNTKKDHVISTLLHAACMCVCVCVCGVFQSIGNIIFLDLGCVNKLLQSYMNRNLNILRVGEKATRQYMQHVNHPVSSDLHHTVYAHTLNFCTILCNWGARTRTHTHTHLTFAPTSISKAHMFNFWITQYSCSTNTHFAVSVEGEVEFNSVLVLDCEIAEISVFHLGERLCTGVSFITRILARSIL